MATDLLISARTLIQLFSTCYGSVLELLSEEQDAMPLSRRYLSMTPFTVMVPKELWLAIEIYRDKSGADLATAYEEAEASYFAAIPDLSLADMCITGQGGVRKTIWLPRQLGDAVRASGRRTKASYSSIIIMSLSAHFLH